MIIVCMVMIAIFGIFSSRKSKRQLFVNVLFLIWKCGIYGLNVEKVDDDVFNFSFPCKLYVKFQ